MHGIPAMKAVDELARCIIQDQTMAKYANISATYPSLSMGS